MSPAELVGSLRRRGVVLVPSGDGQLRYRPQAALSQAECSVLAVQREAILDCLASDPVGWRAAVMATQIRSGHALPLLLARPGIRFPLGMCCSCGDQLAESDRYRCASCTAATLAALKASRWSWRSA